MDNKTYVHILTDTLFKKNFLLDKLIQITEMQEKYITLTPPDIDNFESSLTDKEIIIEKINELDEGFEKIYEHVKEEIVSNKLNHKVAISELQNLIKQVTEKSAKLQTLELKNKKSLEIFFANKKKEIRDFKKSSETASSYYKNMMNQQLDESYFLDKKK
ncbi:MAG: flagellar export chaperone FlgN [Anaerocolumna aminovalerica]|uniref:flagellar export chaperone FlgN n=1 Tax=Anaerocolumna aminovalerica TaxID=1527 RepID=UPI000BE404E1|nr:flagellar export chaperone FlgN [Anaerocolumna aminovalerica]MDU6263945.1 flagellar export chaperone FlgN [Anaerocolumna aminovalerica]